MRSQASRQGVFTIGMLVCCVIEATIAWFLVGIEGVEGVCFSILLCAIPGWLTIFAADLLRHRDLGAYAVLFGTGVRLLFVVLGWVAIGAIRPDLGFREFVVWLLVGYLVSLALETWMVLLTQPVESGG